MRRVGVAGLLGLVGLVLGLAGCQSERPNIVFIYADDLGWRDLGVQGSQFYLTPNIDGLAKRGVRFTRAYSNAPNCAPSRASLLTGLYAPRHGIYTVGSAERGRSADRRLIPVSNRTVLDTSFTTIAEVLRGSGYRTGFFGKWHLGGPGFGPADQGFDTAAGWTQWGSPPSYSWPYERGRLTLSDLRDSGRAGENLTDRLTSEAIEFIEEADGPFFLMLSHYAVHTPIEADSSRIGRFEDRPADGGHKDARYASMIAAVDDGVGRILEALERAGLSENTYVIFTSDNGGFGPITDMLPLRGSKGMLYEGGIRVPLIVSGPDIAPAVSDEPMLGTDFFATFQEWAGIPEPTRSDGESMLRALSGVSPPNARALFWHFPAYLEAYRGQDTPWRTAPVSAVMMGHKKLIRNYEGGEIEVYDLLADPGEGDRLDVDPSLNERLSAWLDATDAFIPSSPNPEFRQPRP